MELKLLDEPVPRTLHKIKSDGSTVYKKQNDGKPYQVPIWCGMTLRDHACIWGCMGIEYGYVSAKGSKYCESCELYSPKNQGVGDHQMAKYRKKPIVIEAFQLTEETRRSNETWPEWAHAAWQKKVNEVGSLSPFEDRNGDGPLRIFTLEGILKVDMGDYIIQGVNGELYPCKPDIFEKTYEKVD